MSYRLEWVFQFRVLLCKRTELHIALTPAEQSRLERLRGQVQGGVPELDADGSPLAEALRARYVHAGRFHEARVCNLSGAGVAVLTAEPPPAGQHLQLQVWDPSQSLEYTFPGRVIERASDTAPGMRLAFEGLPVQTRVMSPRMGPFTSMDTRAGSVQ
jgi:hypothetical protein